MSDLVASAARLVSGVSANFALRLGVESARFQLNVTAAGSAVDDTCDVYLQSSVDGGVTWDDFIHFTQVLGNGGAKRYTAKWMRNIAPTTAIGPAVDGALAVGVSQGPIGAVLRAKWVIVAGAGTHSFTFSIAADVYRR